MSNPRVSVHIVLHDCEGVAFNIWRGPVVEVKEGEIVEAVRKSVTEAVEKRAAVVS